MKYGEEEEADRERKKSVSVYTRRALSSVPEIWGMYFGGDRSLFTVYIDDKRAKFFFAFHLMMIH